MKRRWIMFKDKPYLLLTLVTLFITQIGVAYADDNLPSKPDLPIITSYTMPMMLDCHNLTESAQEYADEHNLCPKGGRVTPQDTRYGDCGSSTLWVSNLGSGNARFHMSAASSLGTMTNVIYNTNWVNWSTSGSGKVSGSDWPYNITWSRNKDAHTGAGYVSATMTGYVTLWWGGMCTFLPTSDGENIY